MSTTSGRNARPSGAAHALAQGLGWFSIGLGLAELLAPRQISRPLGVREGTSLVRAYGLREIATGIGILTRPDPAPWIWGRVAGDALDLATLSAGLGREGARGDRMGMAIGAVALVTALDLACARALQSERRPEPRMHDYSDRRGMPRPPEEMRGAAREEARGRQPAALAPQ